MKIQPNPNITPNFKLREFDCRDGTICPAKYHANLTRLCELLEDIRTLFSGRMIHIISGYRSQEWNERLINSGRKAAKNSQHMTASAADFVIEGLDIHRVQSDLKRVYAGVSLSGNERLVHGGMKGLGLGANKGFVHVDVREGRRAMWTY